MTVALSEDRDFLTLSRRLLDVLGPDSLGSESDQRQFAVDGVEPTWVLLPANAGETERALRFCSEHELTVVPAGLGARLDRGNPPERVDVVLSTLSMDSIVDHAAADLTLTVNAGATLASVNAALRPLRQWLPFDPPFPAETTIGGLIAANVAGPSRQAFGTVRESLLGVRAVCADGTAVKSGGRVVKNVAGYDLHKLLVGSFGTLAVIVEATFKLQPLPESRALMSFSSPTLARLFRLARALADSAVGPERLEVSIARERDPLLAVVLGGLAEDVDEGRRRAAALASSFGIDAGTDLDDSTFAAELEAFERPLASAVVLRVGVPRSRLGGWLPGALRECGEAARKVGAQAHAGVGVARLRLEDADREGAARVVESLRSQALAAGGYLVVERAPAAWKSSLDVWGPPPAGFDLMKGIKATFDPGRRLAPGRFVGGL